MEVTMIIPSVIEIDNGEERSYGIYSRLLKDRIILLGQQVDDEMANSIVAQMLFLELQDKEKEIALYINSPGGIITSGMAIYDTMNKIAPDVSTICFGQAMSMGSFLLSGGAKGKRYALPHSSILIHQPLGGAKGQASDIEIEANHIMSTKKMLYEEMAKNTGQDYETVEKACDRDNYMTAKEAKDFGLIDEIL